MDKEVKELWIADLRSGRHKQARKALKKVTSNSYCCLGRLCDIRVNMGYGQWEPGVAVDYSYFLDNEGKRGESYPPTSTLKWADLDDYTVTKLAGMNDEGKTFEEIADWIEEHL